MIPPRGGVHHSTTYHGHEFYYEYDGTGNYFVMDLPNVHKEQLVVLANHRGEGIRVRCDISVNAGRAEASFDIMVQPSWAPRGATRFLELVRAGYYNGVVFNRVVPKFLIQFGIAEGYKERTDVQDVAIWDDYPRNIAFEPGTISYAGSGFDSRTSEIFIAMPGSSKEQLSKFGENSWETPFGFVEGDLSVLNKIYYGYGDMVRFFRDIWVDFACIEMYMYSLVHSYCIISSLHGGKVLIRNVFMRKMDIPNTCQRIFRNLTKSRLVTLLTKLAWQTNSKATVDDDLII